MRINLFRTVILLGALAIIGIVVVQFYWLIKAWDLKDKEFDISVQIALNRSALEVAKYNEVTLPKENLINRRSSNIYAVNINSPINPFVLENILYEELRNVALLTEFEYAVYDCESDQLVYGNYCEIESLNKPKSYSKIPKFELLNHYFVIIFPNRQSFLVSNFKTNLLLALLAVFSVLVFTSFIFIVFKQRKQSNLQQDFINNMTHEFKTPISSIKLALNSLKNQLNTQDNERIHKYISIIENQNKRLNNQIENILQISKIENNALEIVNNQTIQIGGLLSDIIDEYKISYSDFIFHFENNLGAEIIEIDPLHIQNIVSTLLDNAIKYSNLRKEINIIASASNSNFLIKIEDYGIGIAPADQKRVFEKFYRVNTGNKHDVKGFGLGLHYVKTMCDALKWKVILESEINRGTTISVIIPKIKK
ncbi:MAG TPA: HAMP domain-containing sensor histidine kinase [Saprospiraceae bacterium]|nr:HAMP domain-containing sensor histidine kinase [Saprospiraceae bacterium]